jgi:tetratricopeptide (TPR) repeat protein
MAYQGASFSIPTTYGIVGGSLLYLGYGTITGYTNSEEQLDLPGSYDAGAVFSYAIPLKTMAPLYKEFGAIGINLKFIQSSLSYYSAEAVALDVGGICNVPYIDGLAIGAAYKNVGSAMKFVKETAPLPTTLTLGLAYRNAAFKNLLLNVDYNSSRSGQTFYSTGLSISPIYFLTLRAGLQPRQDFLFSDFRAGIGLNFGDISFDYAFTPADYFATTHHIGLTLAVGNIIKPETASDYYLDQHFRTACEYYYKKDYIESRQQFEEILSVYPDHYPSQKYLEKIAAALEKAEQHKEGLVRKWLDSAIHAFARKDYLSASIYYRRILRLDLSNDEARAGWEEVEKTLEEVKLEKKRHQNQQFISRCWKRGVLYYEKGDFVKSKEKFNEILAIDPEHKAALNYIVDIDNQLTKIAASQVNDLYMKASDFYKHDNYEEAMRYFEAVVVAAPYRYDAQDFIAQCKKKIIEREEKIQADRIAKEQQKVRNDMESVYDRALKAYEKGDFTEALQYFSKSGELANRYAFKEYIENIASYSSIIKLTLSEQHYKTGFEHFRKNRFESAAAEYRKSIQYNPDNTAAKLELERIGKDLAQQYYEQGMSYFSQNETEKAKDMFQKSLNYQPDKVESLRALERIK